MTIAEVMRDFFLKRLVPLQERSHPSWGYQGMDDATRLHQGGDTLTDPAEADLLVTKFMGPGKPGSIFKGVSSLCERDDANEILLQIVIPEK